MTYKLKMKLSGTQKNGFKKKKIRDLIQCVANAKNYKLNKN